MRGLLIDDASSTRGSEAQWWREIPWFDEALARAVTTGQGDLWFVAGNHRGVLDQIRAVASATPGCVGVGPGATGVEREVRDEVVGVCGAPLPIAAPLAELVATLGDSGTSTLRSHQAPPGKRCGNPFGLLDDLMSTALECCDGVVFLVDAEQADPGPVGVLFLRYLAQARWLSRGPVVVVVGLGRDAPELVEVDEAHPVTIQHSAQLARTDQAGWAHVPLLTPEFVANALPLTDEAASLLVAIADGEDRSARARWARWFDISILSTDSNVWRLTAWDETMDALERSLAKAVGPDPSRVGRARMALCGAAVIGNEFCVEAVARAAALEGHDYEAIVDDLDALVGDGETPALLVSAGWDANLPGRTPEHLWRYGFRDPAIAALLRGLARVDRGREPRMRALLTSLVDVRLEDGTFDRAIGRLARETGQRQLAASVEGRIAARLEQGLLHLHGNLLGSAAASWDPADPWLCEQLCHSAERLMHGGFVTSTIPVATAAVRLAQAAAAEPPASRSARRSRGHREPDELHDRAVDLSSHRELDVLDVTVYLPATSHHHRDDEPEPTPVSRPARRGAGPLDGGARSGASRRHLAAALRVLGIAHSQRAAYGEAVQLLTLAHTHYQALFDAAPDPTTRWDLAATLRALGLAHGGWGDHAYGLRLLEGACSHYQVLFNGAPNFATRRNLAETLRLLGTAHRGRGDHAYGLRLLESSCRHHRILLDVMPGDREVREGLSEALYQLGLAERAGGHEDRALAHLHSALELCASAHGPPDRRRLETILHALGPRSDLPDPAVTEKAASENDPS